METKKHHRRLNTKTIVIGLLILLIVILFVVYKISQQRYKPIINPNPKQFITISGKIDPRLKASIVAIYETKNKACFTTKVLMVWHESRTKTLIYSIHPKDNGYSLKMSTDILKKSFCDWQFVGASYQVKFGNHDDNNNNNMLFYLDNLSHKKNKNIKAWVGCYPCGKYNSDFFCEIKNTNFERILSLAQKELRVDFIYYDRGE